MPYYISHHTLTFHVYMYIHIRKGKRGRGRSSHIHRRTMYKGLSACMYMYRYLYMSCLYITYMGERICMYIHTFDCTFFRSCTFIVYRFIFTPAIFLALMVLSRFVGLFYVSLCRYLCISVFLARAVLLWRTRPSRNL